MPKSLAKRALPLLTVLFLAGCTLGPDYEQPQVNLPENWPDHSLLSEAEVAAWRTWWTRYEDPTLNRLVARALDDNLDIRLQAQRVQEARARLGLAEAERLPTLDAQVDAIRQSESEAVSPFPGRGGVGNVFSITGTLGYELDLWGRLQRSEEAAAAILDESIFSREAVQLAAVSDVVATYTDLRAARQELAIVQSTIESREETLALEQVRFESGETDALALRQAESELETTRARLPLQRERVQTLESALAVLVGMSPAELFGDLDFGEGGLDALTLPEGVPAVLPSELLRRRPDIRAAEAGLVATTAQIGVTEADRLPRLNLSTFLGTTAMEVGDLFTAPTQTWGLGASVLGPIFNFGRSEARVDTAEALRDQAETQYRITVTTAFREVRDALVVYDTSSDRVESVRRQVEALRETLRLARLRYDEGFIGFIEVLDAQRALLEAELNLTDAIRARLNATATLFKALGGGWEG